ncbi:MULTISPECIES: hypothetical protein [Paenarthrobacter]|nr:hypothetical protein [Paenarthrobacter ureafaciens]
MLTESLRLLLKKLAALCDSRNTSMPAALTEGTHDGQWRAFDHRKA